MEALGINLGFILMQILLFIILMMVLRNYAYDPIINLLEERKAKIAKGLEDARQAAIARENADAEAKKILDNFSAINPFSESRDERTDVTDPMSRV